MNTHPGHPFAATEFDRELTENILPFWVTRSLDHQNGGFHGAITASNEVQKGSKEVRSCAAGFCGLSQKHTSVTGKNLILIPPNGPIEN
jgi:hypothetical protein